MYTQQEKSRLRQAFWTAFGKYMAPIASSEGGKINWVNYKTGVKNVYFKMEADDKKAGIFIEIAHADLDARQYYFERFEQLKTILHGQLQEVWDWEPGANTSDGRIISTIGTALNDVNIFKQEDWPAIISFLKSRIMALDEFWNLVKDGFA